jgi:hypothetical protein
LSQTACFWTVLPDGVFQIAFHRADRTGFALRAVAPIEIDSIDRRCQARGEIAFADGGTVRGRSKHGIKTWIPNRHRSRTSGCRKLQVLARIVKQILPDIVVTC